MDKGLTPPTLHDLERLRKWTRVWPPPNPSRLEAAPQMDKGLTPPTLHDLEQLPNGQGFGPPQPFTTWRGSQMDKGWTPQPFTTWSGSQMDKGWTPQPFTTWRVFLCLYNVPFTLRCRPISRFPYFASSREGVALPKCLSES